MIAKPELLHFPRMRELGKIFDKSPWYNYKINNARHGFETRYAEYQVD